MASGLAARLLQARDEAAGAVPARRALALLAATEPATPAAALLALPVGEGDRRLLALRRALLGDRLLALADCPACAAPCELELDLAALTLPAARAAEVTVEQDGWRARARLPVLADLLAAAATPATARATLLARCLLEAARHGAPVEAKALPAPVVAALAAALAEADPQADIELDVTCPTCSHAMLLPFDIAGFLWRELEAWADGLLLDVHALAQAYGWSERAILALPPARRRRYLALVGG